VYIVFVCVWCDSCVCCVFYVCFKWCGLYVVFVYIVMPASGYKSLSRICLVQSRLLLEREQFLFSRYDYKRVLLAQQCLFQ